MFIVLILDIYFNWEVFQVVWKEVKYVDMIFCMGDFVGYGVSLNEVVEFVRKQMGKRIFFCVWGNYDNVVVFGVDWGFNFYVREVVRWYQWVMKSENIEFFRRFLVRQFFIDDVGRIYLFIYGFLRVFLDEYFFLWFLESEFRVVFIYIRQDDFLVGYIYILMFKVIEG